MTRRRFLRRLILAVSTAIGGLLSASGFARWVEPRRLVVERVTVPVEGLPERLRGYKVGVLTDLHLGDLVPVDFVRKAAALLMAEKPDLIAVVGDFVSLREAVAELPAALAPFKGAAVGVLGNWDYYVPEMRSQKAVRLLVNQGFEAAPGLWVAGIDDAMLGDPDLGKALRGAPANAIRILLAHEPDFADSVKPEHKIALQISGHSHGGQVRLPIVGPLMLPPGGRRYPMGLARAPHCTVYTSRGVGVAHLPVRFLCPPEVTVITLE